MSTDVVCFWWQREEFSEQRGDWQTGASLDIPGADLLKDDYAVASMLQAPLGEPPTDFLVRSVYDVRPVNGYDFNYSAGFDEVDAFVWSAQFNVPNGYRAIPRKWTVYFDNPPLGPASISTATLLQNGAAVPNNDNIIIGMGTGSDPIESFFICEENTTFGIQGLVDASNSSHSSTMSVNVYGNLIPVTEVSLPFSIANQINQTAPMMLED
jgi:hypothetical protein